MPSYLQTRGRGKDYTFIGESPSAHWWRDYRTVTAFEDPTVLLEREGTSWRCLVSGIPSCRSDRVGTIIRYTVVLEGACGDGPDSTHAGQLLYAAAHTATGQTPFSELTAVLDGQFPEDFVEDCLARRDDPEIAAGVRRRLESALAALSAPQSTQRMQSIVPASWVGSSLSDAVKSEFAGRAGDIISGKRLGRACVLNLIDTADDALTLLAATDPLAVMVTTPSNRFGDTCVALTQKKKLASRARAWKASFRVPPTKIVLVAGLLTMLAAWAIASAIWRRQSSPATKPIALPTTKAQPSEKPLSNSLPVQGSSAEPEPVK
jgi:hypothetical protein